jgi:hypothetical protein
MSYQQTTDERTILSSQAVTGAVSSESVDCSQYSEAEVYISVSAKSGTSPTADWDVQTSPDDSAWHQHGNIPQVNDPSVTTVYRHAVHHVTNLGKYLRVDLPSMGGSSTPSLTTEIKIILKT